MEGFTTSNPLTSEEYDHIGSLFAQARDPPETSPKNRTEDESSLILDTKEYEGISFIQTVTSLEFVGLGGNRIAFTKDSDTVIVFPRNGIPDDTFTDGVAANNNEIHIWSSLQDAEKTSDYNLLPLISWSNDGLWIEKPKITPVSKDTEEIKQEWDSSGKDEVWDNLFGFDPHINLMEITANNSCKYNGSFVLFDYGTRSPVEN